MTQYEMYVNGRHAGKDTYSSDTVESVLSDAKQNRPESTVDDQTRTVTTCKEAVKYTVQFRPKKPDKKQ